MFRLDTGKNKLRILLTLIILPVLSGCATTKRDLPIFNTHFRAGAYIEAGILAGANAGKIEESHLQTTDLLWALQAGSAKRACGEYQESTLFFDASENAIKRYNETGTVTNGASSVGSILINDTVMAYRPEEYDGIMVNTYKALNFWAQGDIENTRVEFLRALERQTRAKERFARQIAEEKENLKKKQLEADEKRARRLASARTTEERYAIRNEPRLDIGKSAENPEIDRIMRERYSNLDAFEAYPDFINPITTYLAGLFFAMHGENSKASDLLKETYGMVRENGYVAEDFKRVEDLLDGKKQAQNLVWVVFENGAGPEKEEVRVDLPLFLFTRRATYTGIAFPRLKSNNQAYPYLNILSDNGERVQTQVLADMERVIQTEFKKDFPLMVSKAVVSALIKTYGQYLAQNEFGQIGGILGGIYQLITTSADIRIWTALPKDFQVARFLRPENGRIRIQPPGEEAFEIQLPPSGFSVIYVKIPKKGVKPIYQVFKA